MCKSQQKRQSKNNQREFGPADYHLQQKGVLLIVDNTSRTH